MSRKTKMHPPSWFMGRKLGWIDIQLAELEILGLWRKNDLTDFKSIVATSQPNISFDFSRGTVSVTFSVDSAERENDNSLVRNIRRRMRMNKACEEWNSVKDALDSCMPRYFSYKDVGSILRYRQIDEEVVRNTFNWIISAIRRIKGDQIHDVKVALKVANAIRMYTDPRAVAEYIEELGIPLLAKKRLNKHWEEYRSQFNPNWWAAWCKDMLLTNRGEYKYKYLPLIQKHLEFAQLTTQREWLSAAVHLDKFLCARQSSDEEIKHSPIPYDLRMNLFVRGQNDNPGFLLSLEQIDEYTRLRYPRYFNKEGRGE